MKATFEFDLPDDAEEYRITAAASQLYRAVTQFDGWLRRTYKHRDMNDDEHRIVEEVKAAWYEIRQDLPE